MLQGDMHDMEDTVEVTTYDEAMAAWNGEAVLVRPELDSVGDPVVYVYPQLGRGYSYYGFSLRHEAVLQTFRNEDQALMWARSRGYDATIIR